VFSIVILPLNATTFEHVALLPCMPDRRSPSGYSFGAIGPDGAIIPAFDHPWCEHRQPDGFVPRRLGTFIYGGLLMDHFGHFLLEAMSRLWFIRAHPELPVVWHEIRLPVPHTCWPGWWHQLWQLLGLDHHRHHVIREPRRFGRVIVPQPGLSLNDGLHPAQATALAVLPPQPPSGERVWLSRAALPERFGRLLGEELLQQRLAELGWKIRYPETVPVADQVATFAQATIVAGFAGSAFHAVLLCVQPRARLCILSRPSIATDVYDVIAQARGIDQKHIAVPLLRPSERVNAWTTFELASPEAAAEAVITS
jgi:capsular polysaccharide biosynthesis protein